jgi:hypothetical protein
VIPVLPPAEPWTSVDPGATAVTSPEFETDAIDGFWLDQAMDGLTTALPHWALAEAWSISVCPTFSVAVAGLTETDDS